MKEMTQDVGEGASRVDESVCYAAVLDAIEDAAFRIDPDHRVANVNDTLHAHLGRDKVLGSPCEQLIVEDDRGRFLAAIEAARRDDDVEPVRVTFSEPSLGTTDARVRALPTGGAVVVLTDTADSGAGVPEESDDTESPEGRQSTAAEGQQFRTLVNAVEDYAIFRLDADGQVVSWNEGAARIKGYTETEIIGEHFSTFYTPEDREAGIPERNLEAAAEHGRIEEEGWRVRKDGSQFVANVVINTIYDEDGEVIGYAKVTRDLTEQRERQRRLDRARSLTEQVFETSPVGVLVFDEEGALERANSRAYEIIGATDLTDDDLPLGEQVDFAIYTEDGTRLDPDNHPVNEVIDTGEPVAEQQIAMEQPDGSRTWLLVNAAPITDPDGEIERVVVTAEDITSIEQRAQALERTREGLEAELNDVFDRVTDAFYALDDEFRFTYINDRANDIINSEGRDLIGESLWEAFPATVDSQIEEAYRHAMEEQTSIRFEEFYSPLEAWFEFQVYPSPSGISIYFRDITERKEHERELEQHEAILETIDDGVYVLDENSEFIAVNQAYTEITGYDRDDLVGTKPTRLLPDEGFEQAEAARDEMLAGETDFSVLETEVITDDGDHVPIEARMTLFPVGEDEYGRVGVVRDITERKEYEQTLERYRTLTQAISDVIVTMDETGVIRSVNPSVTDVFGYEPAELEGKPLTTIMPDRFRAGHLNGLANYLETDEPGLDWEYLELTGQHADGHEVPLAISFSEYEHDGERFFTGVVRDITERKERERDLERTERQFETTFNNPVSFMGLLDPDGTVRQINETALAFADVAHEDVEGEMFWETPWFSYSSEVQTTVRDAIDRAVEGEYVRTELKHRSPDGETAIIDAMLEPVHDDDGDVVSVLASGRDITERKEREQALRDAYEIITDPDDSFEERIDSLLEFVREIVGTRYATLSHAQDGDYVFEAVASPDGADIQPGDSVPVEATNCEHVITTEETLSLRDIEADAPEMAAREGNAEWGISCYLGAPVLVDDEVYGTFCFYDMEAQEEDFSDWKVTFIDLLSNWVGYELSRQQHTDRLAALNDLNEVVRDVNEAIVQESTREEVEQQVCERLAASDSYEFAWVGEVERGSNEVSIRAEAGVEGYLDDTTITISDKTGQGPTGRAFRTQEMQVARNLLNNPAYEPWADHAERYGVRSSAAIPIAYDDTLYGALNVYSTRPDGFVDEERTVIEQIGEILGHAINAIERKEALMSDEIVEIEFQMPNVVGNLVTDVDCDGRITLDRTIALSDDSFLEYGTVTADAIDLMEELVDQLPHWKEVTYQGDPAEHDTVQFELQLTDPPVLSTVAENGGRVRSAVIDDGAYEMIVEIPPNGDVRAIVETVQDEYSSAELVAQRRTSRAEHSTSRTLTALTEQLTDRQRASLEAAYFSGYFEWPRESSGEDIAESMGVSSPTFHQHLRSAQRKVVGSVFDGGTGD